MSRPPADQLQRKRIVQDTNDMFAIRDWSANKLNGCEEPSRVASLVQPTSAALSGTLITQEGVGRRAMHPVTMLRR
jgi:hypothetical protein